MAAQALVHAAFTSTSCRSSVVRLGSRAFVAFRSRTPSTTSMSCAPDRRARKPATTKQEMLMATTFDVEAYGRALSQWDVDALLEFYVHDAEFVQINRENPPSAPRVHRGRETLA